MSSKQHQPPKWPLRLMKLFVKKEFLEEIEGDMEELFSDNVEQHGYRKAKRIYIWEVLRLFRPILVKNMQPLSFNQAAMFRNYFKISFRSLMKNPMSSFINVFGLSIAIGICLVVFAFMEYDYSIDQFHKNKDKVYLTTFFAKRDGAVHQYGLTPRPLGDMIKHDFPQVSNICRVKDRSVVIKQDDNAFHERIRFADASFLSMFTFPLKWGVSKSLSDINSVVLSEDMSIKYFGEENPVGQEMLMIFNDSTKKVFTVTGVAATFPKARDISFDFLVNFDNLETAEKGYDKNDWSKFLDATFVEIENPDDVAAIQLAMDRYKLMQNEAQPDWKAESFALEQLTTLHDRAVNIKDAIVQDYNVEGRIGLPIIGIFMISLACFNYINIAIVSAAKRLKEIGVRKVIGANRQKVIIQFLTENIVITFFALIIGLLFCAFVFLPWFVQFTGWELELRMLSKNLWIFLLVLVLFTGIASGVYPAFYISKFETVKIFRGSLQFGKKNPLTRIFLGVQLILACITITAGVVFTQNNRYQYSQSWGYNHTETLFVNTFAQSAFTRMQEAMAQDPNVISSSGSKEHLGKAYSTALLRTAANEQFEVQAFSVDAEYFNTMDLRLKEGRVFNRKSENDKKSIVVNEVFVKRLNLPNPVGQQFDIEGNKYEIVGVLQDFHNKNFFFKMEPAIFTLADEKDFRYLTLRVKQGKEDETKEALQKNWTRFYPEIPFSGGYQQEVWTNYFFSVDRSEKFNDVIASIAVLLASLGLYGLVSLNISGRTKEFSIRKTLGANVRNIASVIIKQYVPLTAIALIIGGPLSYVFTKAYLDMLFAYPMPMDLTGTGTAMVILVIVLLIVISTQIKKVLSGNPVEGLKAE